MTTTYTPTAAIRATSDEFDDGDPPSAAAINPLPEAALDTATWAAYRRHTEISSNDDGTSTLGSNAGHDPAFGTGTVALWDGIVQPLDWVEIAVSFHVSADASSTQEFRLAVSYGVDAPVPIGGARAVCYALTAKHETLFAKFQSSSSSHMYLWLEQRAPNNDQGGYIKAPMRVEGSITRPLP